MSNNRFVTVEGIDGSGKSTFTPLIKSLIEKLVERELILTREPGGTPLAEEFREYFLRRKMDKKTELLLAFASRNEHIKDIIQPALDKGSWVISDRFTDSTYAYQGYANNVDSIRDIEVLEQLVQEDLRPGLTLLFLAPTEVCMKRLSETGKNPDKFEIEAGKSDFFQKALDGYKDLALKDKKRYKIIDASKSLEDVSKQVIEVVSQYINDLKKSIELSDDLGLVENKKLKLR